MKKVYIAIEANIEHKESIYVLVTSIINNKKKNSKYCIYIITTGDEKNQWEQLLSFNDNNVQICLYDDSLQTLAGVEKVIYLQWNTMVMGDLSELYEIDLENKSFAAARNFPENICNIPSDKKEYNSSVCVVDVKRWNKEQDSDYKEISMFYNYGYEEFVRNQQNVLPEEIGIREKDFNNVKNWALILRMDKMFPAERYFDGLLSELWMKYYQMSPLSKEAPKRIASIETIGEVTIDTDKAVPILLTVEDANVAYVIALILSLEDCLSQKRQLDLRIVYHQLSKAHKEMLLSLQSDRVSIVLYNTKSIYKNQSVEALSASIFTEYKKALYLHHDMICVHDISNLYDVDMDNIWIAMPQMVLNDNCDCNINNLDVYFSNRSYLDSSVMLCNVEEWNRNTIYENIHKYINDKNFSRYSLNEIINILFSKNVMELPGEKYFCKKDEDIEQYRELVNNYISTSQWCEQCREEIRLYEQSEEEDMKEIVNRINKLEAENSTLKEKNSELRTENKRLGKERDRFLYEILEIRKSFTYKVGRMITFIPRMLRGNK